MSKVSKRLTAAILSMSLICVMAGAAVAPALGVIKLHFGDVSDLLLQFIISLPAVFIIVTNLFFNALCQRFNTKTLALAGLILYIVAGCLPVLLDNIYLILFFRAILGVSVGLIMPLSTGLLSFYYPPESQAKLMGLSVAMCQSGGVAATLLAGFLAYINWNYTFSVYLFGFIPVVLIVLYLPDNKLVCDSSEKPLSLKQTFLKFHPSVTGMFLGMSLFFVFPCNFSIISMQTTDLSGNYITCIMVGLDIVAMFPGFVFGKIMNCFGKMIKYIAPTLFFVGYAFYAFAGSVVGLIIGSIIIGLANGVSIPYLNTIASVKAGRNAARTVMPLLSASLYLGQFLSPLFITQLSKSFSDNARAPYFAAIVVAVIFFVQAFLTRNFQSQPPENSEE